MTAEQIEVLRNRQGDAGGIPMVEFWLAEIALQLARIQRDLRSEAPTRTTDEMEAAQLAAGAETRGGPSGLGYRYHVVHRQRSASDLHAALTGAERDFDTFGLAERYLETLGPDFVLVDGQPDPGQPQQYVFDRQEGRAVPVR